MTHLQTKEKEKEEGGFDPTMPAEKGESDYKILGDGTRSSTQKVRPKGHPLQFTFQWRCNSRFRGISGNAIPARWLKMLCNSRAMA